MLISSSFILACHHCTYVCHLNYWHSIAIELASNRERDTSRKLLRHVRFLPDAKLNQVQRVTLRFIMARVDSDMAKVEGDARDVAMEDAQREGYRLELGDMFVVCSFPSLSNPWCRYEQSTMVSAYLIILRTLSLY
jgi:hypothetical protein